MLLLSCWLLFPIVAIAICVGLALGVQRLCGIELPATLLPVLGLASLIVIVNPFYAVGLGATAPIVVTLVASLAGYLATWGRQPLRGVNRWHLAAGLAAFGVYAAPVVLSGQATFAGYNFLNDTAIHFVLMDQLAAHGTHLGALQPSSYASALSAYLASTYPLGSHEALTTLRGVFPVDVAYIYQPFLSLLMAFSALAAARLLSFLSLPNICSAALGFAASIAYLPFAYAMQGSIKELALISLLAGAAALGAELLAASRPLRLVAPVGVITAAALATYNVGALPWLAPLVGMVFAALLWRQRAQIRSWLAAAGAFVVVTVALSIPTLLSIQEFIHSSAGLVNSKVETGNLMAPLRVIEGVGVWLSGDFRVLGMSNRPLTYILIAAIAALACIGAIWCVEKRVLPPLLYAVPALAGYLLLRARSNSPWVEAKALTVLSPAPILLTAGAVGLARRYSAALAVTFATIVLGSVLAADIFVYRSVALAPAARLHEQSQVERKFAGHGPTLFNEFDEYAKHFLRRTAVNDPYEAWTPSPAQPKRPVGTVFGKYLDLDELQSGFVQAYPLIVTRKSPAASRPPSNYRLAFDGRYYQVWERTGPAPLVHDPLGNRYTPFGKPSCAQIEQLGQRARRLRDELATWIGKQPIVLRPAGFPLSKPSVALPFGARPGTYEAWIGGTAATNAGVRINGGPTLKADQIEGPGQYSRLGQVTLGTGKHSVRLSLGRGSFKPGAKLNRNVDAVALAPRVHTRAIRVSPQHAQALCGRNLDWIEIVRKSQ